MRRRRYLPCVLLLLHAADRVAGTGGLGAFGRGAAARPTTAPEDGAAAGSESGGAAEKPTSQPLSNLWPRQLAELLPEVKLLINPTTTLKLRKRIEWLRTCLTVGADYNTQASARAGVLSRRRTARASLTPASGVGALQDGTWQMRSSWEDNLIGGQISMKGGELQLTKSWIFQIADQSNLAAKLRLKAAVDVRSGRSYARFGFRTEQVRPSAARGAR